MIQESSKVSCRPRCRFSVKDKGFQFTVIKSEQDKYHLSTALLSESTGVFTEDWQRTVFPMLLLPPPFIVLCKSSGCQGNISSPVKTCLYDDKVRRICLAPRWRDLSLGAKSSGQHRVAVQHERVQKHCHLGRIGRDVLVWMPKTVPWILKWANLVKTTVWGWPTKSWIWILKNTYAHTKKDPSGVCWFDFCFSPPQGNLV